MDRNVNKFLTASHKLDCALLNHGVDEFIATELAAAKAELEPADGNGNDTGSGDSGTIQFPEDLARVVSSEVDEASFGA